MKLLQTVTSLIEDQKYFVSDSSVDSDGYMILVMSNANAGKDGYYGVNVIFDDGKKPSVMTADPMSDRESRKDKDQIIKIAQDYLDKLKAGGKGN